MFPQAVPENFSLGRVKLGYLTTEALGPYFNSKLVKDAPKFYYSLLYDKTTNNEGKKELQVSIRYWSFTSNGIIPVIRHLQTMFMGHATAKDLPQKMLD